MDGVATGGGGVKELLEKVSVSTRPVRAAVTGAAGFFPAAGSVFDVLDVIKACPSLLSLKRILVDIHPLGHNNFTSESRKRLRYSSAVSFRSFDQW